MYTNGDMMSVTSELIVNTSSAFEINTESKEFIYGESVEVNSLKNLDLGESVELSEGGSITCLVNFDNNEGNVLEFLDSYAKMMEMV